jgi:hypothetical protein
MGGMMLRRGAPFEARPLGAHLRMTGIGKCVRHPEVGAKRPSKDAPPPPLTASRTERSGDPGHGGIGEGGKRAVIPAQAGIQILVSAPEWIPACAGMTEEVEVGAKRPSKDAPPPPLTASQTERSGDPGHGGIGEGGKRPVIPAQAGIQILVSAPEWIPACAGMTEEVEVGATRPSKDAPTPPLTASRTERSGDPGHGGIGEGGKRVVIPAKAGTQLLAPAAVWSPACAGMTKRAAP